jgi:hypothetical protein
MYHKSGIEAEFVVFGNQDINQFIIAKVAEGFSATIPNDEDIAKWSETAASADVITVSHIVRSHFVNRNGKKTDACYVYTSWGKSGLGSQMTLYMNSADDITALEEAAEVSWNDMPVLEDNSGPKKDSGSFHEFAVKVDFSLTRNKVDAPNSPTGYRWALVGYGASAGVSGAQSKVSPGDAFNYALSQGVGRTELMEHLEIENFSDYRGDMDDVKAAVTEFLKLKTELEEQGDDTPFPTEDSESDSESKKKPKPKPKSKSKPKPKSKPSKMLHEVVLQPKPAPPSKPENDLWCDDPDVYQQLVDSCADLIGTEFDELGLVPEDYADQSECWNAIRKWALQDGGPLYASAVQRVVKARSVWIQFNSIYDVRWYGSRKELADILDDKRLLTLEQDDGELELGYRVSMVWEHKKSRYLQAKYVERVSEPEQNE